MSAHKAIIEWQRESATFEYAEYNRNHHWHFDSITIEASSAPGYLGDAELVDPEEAFVASLSSCHMLTFLALASKKGFVVDSYKDKATGVLSKNEEGKLCMTHVTLRPQVVFSGERMPDEAAIARINELAHRECFIANSVKTKISIEAPAT
ncbi:MAG: OsmC family peroxiredoxin [Gammaproteobacteria bacterium]|nr:OsmC family peroxiredoxin [Gammaproteobacteria bacterium]